MSVDGARSSALRFNDDVGVPGHTHPGYARHFTGSEQPEYPQIGDLWSIGAYIEHRYVSVSGAVDGETVEEFPDFTTEPNPTYLDLQLGPLVPAAAVITVTLSISPDVSPTTPIQLTVVLGSKTWQWDVYRDENVTVQETSFPVTLPSDLEALVDDVTVQLILPFGTTSVSVVDFVVATSNDLEATQWWDGVSWKTLGASQVAVTPLEPDVTSGLELWVDSDGVVHYNNDSAWLPTKPAVSSTGHGVSVTFALGSSVSLPKGTWHTLPFNEVTTDNGGMTFNSSTGTITVSEDGFYLIRAALAFPGGATSARRVLGIWVNGAIIGRGDDTNVSTTADRYVGVSAQAVRQLFAGDVVEAQIWTTDAADLTTDTSRAAAHSFEVWSMGGIRGADGPPGATGAQGPAGPEGPEGPQGPSGTLENHSHPNDYLRLDGANSPVLASGAQVGFYLGDTATAPGVVMAASFGGAELSNPNGNLWLKAKDGSFVESHGPTTVVHREFFVDTSWLGTVKFRVDPNTGTGKVSVLGRAVLEQQVSAAAMAPVTVVGEVRMFTITAPAGWLELNGQTVAYNDYPQLGAAWGFSAGQNFTLPNFDDRVPMGGGTLRSSGGNDIIEKRHLPPHEHSMIHEHNLTRSSTTGNNRTHIPAGEDSTYVETSGKGILSYTGNTGTGSNLGLNNDVFRPKHVRLFFAVYAGYGE
jgi:microcystin-dependent protein